MAQRVLGTGRCLNVALDSFQPPGFPNRLDSWSIIAGSKLATGGAADPLNSTGTAGAYNPIDNKVDPQDIDNLADGAIRYDFLFVATPQDVMYADISNSESAAAKSFTPYRFQTNSDCNSDDPDAPSSGCDKSRLIRYGIKTHGVGTNGDPPGSSTDRVGTFPVCAIQKD